MAKSGVEKAKDTGVKLFGYVGMLLIVLAVCYLVWAGAYTASGGPPTPRPVARPTNTPVLAFPEGMSGPETARHGATLAFLAICFIVLVVAVFGPLFSKGG